jgi:predicted TIM-barrel fold metal-dependent hydrolase
MNLAGLRAIDVRTHAVGSNYPMITPDSWLADFEAIPIKPNVRPLILKEDAARLLRLDGKAA